MRKAKYYSKIDRWVWQVKKTTGILATAGMSCLRVSIKFTDRSVMKMAMPLEISPKDRNGFMKRLNQIYPNIELK